MSKTKLVVQIVRVFFIRTQTHRKLKPRVSSHARFIVCTACFTFSPGNGMVDSSSTGSLQQRAPRYNTVLSPLQHMEHRVVITCTGGRSQLSSFREDEIVWSTFRWESLDEVILTFSGIVYGAVEDWCKLMNWLGEGATRRVWVFNRIEYNASNHRAFKHQNYTMLQVSPNFARNQIDVGGRSRMHDDALRFNCSPVLRCNSDVSEWSRMHVGMLFKVLDSFLNFCDCVHS